VENIGSERPQIKLPPDTIDWTDWISPDYRHRIGNGGYGDVFKGLWDAELASRGPVPEVVVKIFRMPRLPTEKAAKRYIVSTYSYHPWVSSLIRVRISGARLLFGTVSTTNIFSHSLVYVTSTAVYRESFQCAWRTVRDAAFHAQFVTTYAGIQGDIKYFLEKRPEFNRDILMLEVTLGLDFLHSQHF
jgi:hypothetical protein